MGLALFLIGAAAIHWAKKLMPDVEVVEERKAEAVHRGSQRATCSTSTCAASTRAASSAVRSSSAACSPRLAWWGCPRSCCCATSARCPARRSNDHVDEPGMRILVAETHQNPFDREDLTVGTLVSAVPEGIDEVMEEEGNLNELAKSAVMLIRMDPSEIVADQTPPDAEDSVDLPGHLVLLQDLYPRRLPPRALRAAHPPHAVPVPPVDLRPRQHGQRDLRPRRPRHCLNSRSPWMTTDT